MPSRTISEAVANGLAALARMQSPDGSFPLYARPQPRTKAGSWRRCSPLFSTAYVMLGAGQHLPVERKTALARYLAAQRRPDGLWEFDPAYGVPPDSDCTACVLAALVRAGAAVDSDEGATRLRTFWRTPDGPFRTWEGNANWQAPARDDVIVNCNVVHALDLLGAPATATERAAAREMLRRTVAPSRYYRQPSVIAHAAIRAGFGIDDVPTIALARPDPRDVLGCAQWLCATRRADPALIAGLVEAQRPDGSWPVAVWVSGVGSRTPQWGSPTITTALAVEALQAAQDA